MQKINKLKEKTSIWMYLLTYYLIIGSDCILFCFNSNQKYVTFAQYFMVCVSLVFVALAIIKSGGQIKRKHLFLFFTILALLFTVLYYNEFSGGYISLIALFCLGTFFFDVIDPLKFKKAFLDLMTLICIASLITFFFADFCLEIPGIPSVYNTLGREYRFFFLSNISVFDPTRNYGLFTEPSRYQAYLNLALMFLLFDRTKKMNIKQIILFVATLITTFSTTGYIAFAIIVMAFIFSNRLNIKLSYKILFVACIGVVVALLFVSSEDFVEALVKITAGESSISASTRFNSFFANIKMIVDYFPLGTGISNANDAFSTALVDLGNLYASTNTITLLIYFAKFGLISGLYYAINMTKGVKNIAEETNPLLLIVAFVAMTCGISMIESIIFSIIIFYPGAMNTTKNGINKV